MSGLSIIEQLSVVCILVAVAEVVLSKIRSPWPMTLVYWLGGAAFLLILVANVVFVNWTRSSIG